MGRSKSFMDITNITEINITDTYVTDSMIMINPKFTYYWPYDHHPHKPPPKGSSHRHHRHHRHHHHYHHYHHSPPQAIGSRLAAILANDSPEQEPVCRLDQIFHDPVGLDVTDISSL